MDTQTVSTSEQGTYMAVSAKSKKLGIAFLLGPYVLLSVILFVWAMTALLAQTTSPSNAVARIFNVFLGFLGVLAVLGMVIGIPISIIFFSRKEPMQGIFDLRSGKGDASVVPEEIKKWSWGGFAFGWVWGIYHQVWISLLEFIPIVGFVAMIYLGLKGKELAWRKNVWPSVEAFQASQKKWDIAGIIVFILMLTLFVLPFAFGK